MEIEIITHADLLIFKKEMLSEIGSLLKSKTPESKAWLKSAEVRKLLSISAGTLQTLRINGTLNHTKIGGTLYYKSSDINKLMEGDEKN